MADPTYRTDPDVIDGFLRDAAGYGDGAAEAVVAPRSLADVVSVMERAHREGVAVTVSGAGTGLCGGRVPPSGLILDTSRLQTIQPIDGPLVVAGAGATLAAVCEAAEAAGWLYPVDPTETSCAIGATVVNNSSGARTYKYGPTRDYVERIQCVLADGTVLDIRRGDVVSTEGRFVLETRTGAKSIPVPEIQHPSVSKHAAGFTGGRELDLIDLLVGSEGTLCVVTEVALRLVPIPEDLLGLLAFFGSDDALLSSVEAFRQAPAPLDVRAVEFLDRRSLELVHAQFPNVPPGTSALYVELEVGGDDPFDHLEGYLDDADDVWVASSPAERKEIREVRHAVPAQFNELVARSGYPKLGTDLAVPHERFREMFAFYYEHLEALGTRFAVWGHIGDAHLHCNVLRTSDDEAVRSDALYGEFVDKCLALGGTVSAEHGIGKRKVGYLRKMVGSEGIAQMLATKLALDPQGLLGRGTLFEESMLPPLV
jgi:D-lactate dehydrogenase (cytochrome)